jgi:hypothetical protein
MTEALVVKRKAVAENPRADPSPIEVRHDDDDAARAARDRYRYREKLGTPGKIPRPVRRKRRNSCVPRRGLKHSAGAIA